MRMLHRFTVLAVPLIVAVGVAAAATRTTVTVPAWSIHVTDSSGRAVPRACISESWEQYSFEAQNHSAEARADANGNVFFPERRVTASMLRRTVGPLSHLLNVHAGHGAYAFIVVWAPELRGSADYREGGALSHQVVLRPDPAGFHERPDGRCSPPDIG